MNNQEISNEILSVLGVKQGGRASPRLFALYFDDIIPIIENMKYGIKIGNIKVDILLYADDIIILASTINGMAEMLKKLECFGKGNEIKFNVAKTFVMIIHPTKETKRN
jgi:hypothetical protein